MKRLAKVVMAAIIAAFAFGANAESKVDKAKHECAFAAELYDIKYGDSMGYIEIVYNAACEYKAVVPFLDKKIVEEYRLHEKYKEIVEGLKDPEQLKVIHDGEVKGFAIHNRIEAGA
ncbi:TPA: hypothetical protein M2E12_001117 [Escherichia coli]|nr:hypothetical protein [Escherichia coli]